MTKKKDHLYTIDDIAKSVLLGVTVKAVCGREDKFTRERIDDTEYAGSCKNCMAGAAKDAAARDDLIHIHPKEGWQRLIEKAWLARYHESFAPKVSTGSGTWSAWSFKVGRSTKWGDSR